MAGLIQLQAVDYVILTLVMAVTALIGIYYAVVGHGKETLTMLMFGNRRIHYIVLALSLVASQQGGVNGVARQVFNGGITYAWLKAIGRISCFTLMAFVYLPVYYRLQLTTIYEYLQIRFKKKFLRIIGSIAFIIQTVSFMADSLFVPSSALVSVVGFDIWSSAIAIGIICTVYTALGGFQAVVYTDAFQAGIMITGMLAIVIRGSIQEGGINRVWNIATEGKRTFAFDWNLDPRIRSTVPSVTVGFTFFWLAISAGDQIVLQRALSASSLRNAKKAFLLCALIFTFWTSVLCVLGLILYSQYHNCDPLRIGLLTNYLGYVAFYSTRVLGNGYPGVHLSAMFCATLSTFSSGVNSIAAVTLHDILKEIPHLSISEKREGLCMKLLVLGYGVFIVIYAVVISYFPVTEYFAKKACELTLTPLVGIITLGILSKRVNWKGALVGWIVGLLFQLWIFIGGYVVQPRSVPNRHDLPKTTTACLGNITIGKVAAIEDSADSRNVFYGFYQIAFYWEMTFTVLVAMLTGVLVSFFTGGEDEKLDPKSVINYHEVFCPCRYKIKPEEDVPIETDKLQQKPGENTSQNTGKLTKDSGASKLTKNTSQSQKTTSVKNTGKNTEQLQQNHDVVDEDNIKPLEKKHSGLTGLHSNEAIDQTETLPESSNVEETDVAEKSSGGEITA